MKYTDNLIIGAGLSGISTAFHLKKRGDSFFVIDKDNPGGLCSSIKSNGFVFDLTGHVIHYRTRYYGDFIKRIMGDNLVYQKRKALFGFKGHYAPFPFQVFFYKLPLKKLVNQCISSLLKLSDSKAKKTANNFKDWIIENFGFELSKYFLIPYNEKMWQFPLEQISLKWVKKYVPTPNIEMILRFMKNGTDDNEGFGYNPFFYYPKYGGIQSVINSIIEEIGHEFDASFIKAPLQKIVVSRKIAVLEDGMEIKWKKLISTIPVNELLSIIKGVPDNILKCSRELRHNSLVSIHFGIKGKVNCDAHWIYFPELSIPFHRIVFQSNLSPLLSPDSTFSLIVEKSFNPYSRVNVGEIVKETIKTLINLKIINNINDILILKTNIIKYAYPIYDLNWFENRFNILNFLNTRSVYSIGRFGSWEYLSMEDAFLQGKNTATYISK